MPGATAANSLSSPEIGLFEMRELLDICSLLYKPNTSLIVKLKYPHYWGAEHMGNVRIPIHKHNRTLLLTLCRAK